jgi:hypothetical protein
MWMKNDTIVSQFNRGDSMNKTFSVFLAIMTFQFAFYARAEVYNSSLSIAHDQNKMAELRLDISRTLFEQLSSGGGLNFQVEGPDGLSVYGEDVYLPVPYAQFSEHALDGYLLMIQMFEEERLDSSGVVSFFTNFKNSKIVFFSDVSGTNVQTGEMLLAPICNSNKVRNLSGAHKCDISAEQVLYLGLGPESGSCDDVPELADILHVACTMGEAKLLMEERFQCRFTCEEE